MKPSVLRQLLFRALWCLGGLALVGCAAKPQTVRFATFNASLNRDSAGKLLEDVRTGGHPQIKAVAEVIQRVRPDVLLINEFDYDSTGQAPALFQEKYLSVGQNGQRPINYPFRVCLPVNTGVSSGFDLDNDGQAVTEPGTRGYGNDCLGFGQFPGQYGMLLLSRFPIDERGIRTLQHVLWKDMPGALLPMKADGSPWYDDAELAVFRLSSKSHWDVPIQIGRTTVHVLASHPTPPAFDGPEDRNGRRNHDEIRMWADYITGGESARYITGGARAVGPEPSRNTFETTLQGGFRGGRVEYPAPPGSFVIMGDQNADPHDGSSIRGAIQQLLDHPRVNGEFTPRSDGAVIAASEQGGNNAAQVGPAEFDTADFGDSGSAPGNLRCDYVLPSRDLRVIGGGVFWPTPQSADYWLVKDNFTSDHRLVWVDLSIR